MSGHFSDPDSGTFAWSLAEASPSQEPGVRVETIADFNPAAVSAGGDVLDLRDVLSGEQLQGGQGSGGQLSHFLDFDTTSAVGSTIVRISPTGAFAGDELASASVEAQRIVLEGVDLRSALGLDSGATDAQIIDRLLNTGKLLVDF